MLWITGVITFLIGIVALSEYLIVAQNNDYKLISTPSLRIFLFFQEIGIFFILLFLGIFSYLSIPLEYTVIFLSFLLIFDILFFAKKYQKYNFSKRGKITIIFEFSLFLIIDVISKMQIKNIFLYISVTLLLLQLQPIIVKTSLFFINLFFEKYNKKFIVKKSKEFEKKDIRIIGITGSFGKTSCKNILYHLLSDFFPVYATEKNYNTPVGLALSVDKLKGNEKYFICEYGARKKGDITYLTSLFPPSYGLITGVCAQHLQYFGNFHTIYNEKFALAKAISSDGFCVFGDNYFAKKMEGEFAGTVQNECSYKDVIHGVGKTSFTLSYRGEERKIVTNLIGMQAVKNIVACVEMCIGLGVPFEYICARIATLPQTAHRLEYRYAQGVHILDDGYNGNVVGVEYALDILPAYPKPRIVVAQGIIEGGIKQKEENIHIGRKLAGVADVVLLCGTNKRDIRRGLLMENYDKPILICKNMKNVTKMLKNIVRNDCTVYLQNDIPKYF